MESLSEIQELLGDVDQDGDVTIADALYLVRLIVGAESFNGLRCQLGFPIKGTPFQRRCRTLFNGAASFLV